MSVSTPQCWDGMCHQHWRDGLQECVSTHMSCPGMWHTNCNWVWSPPPAVTHNWAQAHENKRSIWDPNKCTAKNLPVPKPAEFLSKLVTPYCSVRLSHSLRTLPKVSREGVRPLPLPPARVVLRKNISWKEMSDLSLYPCGAAVLC